MGVKTHALTQSRTPTSPRGPPRAGALHGDFQDDLVDGGGFGAGIAAGGVRFVRPDDQVLAGADGLDRAAAREEGNVLRRVVRHDRVHLLRIAHDDAFAAGDNVLDVDELLVRLELATVERMRVVALGQGDEARAVDLNAALGNAVGDGGGEALEGLLEASGDVGVERGVGEGLFGQGVVLLRMVLSMRRVRPIFTARATSVFGRSVSTGSSESASTATM